jgi:hypothetical protein
MDDQQREDAPSETVQARGSVRRVREPVAWALLAVTAIAVLVSACSCLACPVTACPLARLPKLPTLPVRSL